MGYFLPYTHNSRKNENFKKNEKTPGDIIILHKCNKNHDHMLYCSRDMAHDTCNCYFSFWAIFWPLFKKLKKMPGDIIILHTFTKNYDWMMYGSWDMVRNRRTDRWTDGWKKWHIGVGVPHLKNGESWKNLHTSVWKSFFWFFVHFTNFARSHLLF